MSDLTRPLELSVLLVSLSLWKEIGYCIHLSPKAGESGWMKKRFGRWGSDFPLTSQRSLFHCTEDDH